MCDHLALGEHEPRKERQAAGETQTWRALISYIPNAVGKTVEERETCTAPEATPKFLLFEQQESQMLPPLCG